MEPTFNMEPQRTYFKFYAESSFLFYQKTEHRTPFVWPFSKALFSGLRVVYVDNKDLK